MPLRDLVALDAIPEGRLERAVAIYSQSCGLVSWLARRRALELGEYLRLMAAEPPGRPAAARHVALFESAFGDIERLEAAWLDEAHDEATKEDHP